MFDLTKRQRFEALTLPHLDAAYSLARWLVRDESEAEDLVQDAYLRAFKGFANFTGEDAKPWIMAIVRNTCYTWFSARGPDRHAVEFDEEMHSASESQESAVDPVVLLSHVQDKRLIDEALLKLPNEYREILILREFEDMSYQDIARITDVPVGTVMSRLSRARRQLARILGATPTGMNHGS